MERVTAKRTEAAQQPPRVRTDSFFKTGLVKTLRITRRIGEGTAFFLSMLPVLASSNLNRSDATTLTRPFAYAQSQEYEQIVAMVKGREVTYYIYKEKGVVLGLSPGRERNAAVKASGPILASCVAENGYYYGLSKTGIVVIDDVGGSNTLFKDLLSDIMENVFTDGQGLSGAPKLEKGSGRSVLVSDSNLKDKKTGLPLMLKFYTEDDMLRCEVLKGEKMAAAGI